MLYSMFSRIARRIGRGSHRISKGLSSATADETGSAQVNDRLKAWFVPGLTAVAKLWLTIGAASLLFPAGWAQDFTFVTNATGSITLKSYNGTNSAVEIPAAIDGYPVKAIDGNAFSNNKALEYVSIPPSVDMIGRRSFWNCRSLTTVAGGQGVTNIGDYAFQLCPQLSTIDLPNTLHRIGANAFDGCRALREIRIPDSVTSLGNFAFQECDSLTSITIPGSIVNVSNAVFGLCDRLTNAVIMPGVETIGEFALGVCPSLKEVRVPASVSFLKSAAFHSSSNLVAVYFEGTPPHFQPGVFGSVPDAIVYYLPDSPGWESTYLGRPTAPWLPRISSPATAAGETAQRFGISVEWATGKGVVVERCYDIVNPDWIPITTNTLTSGSNFVEDMNGENRISRFYRVRSQ